MVMMMVVIMMMMAMVEVTALLHVRPPTVGLWHLFTLTLKMTILIQILTITGRNILDKNIIYLR